jgi:hypothetical protein
MMGMGFEPMAILAADDNFAIKKRPAQSNNFIMRNEYFTQATLLVEWP